MKNGKHEKDYYKQLDGWVRMFEQSFIFVTFI